MWARITYAWKKITGELYSFLIRDVLFNLVSTKNMVLMFQIRDYSIA